MTCYDKITYNPRPFTQDHLNNLLTGKIEKVNIKTGTDLSNDNEYFTISLSINNLNYEITNEERSEGTIKFMNTDMDHHIGKTITDIKQIIKNEVYSQIAKQMETEYIYNIIFDDQSILELYICQNITININEDIEYAKQSKLSISVIDL